MMIREIIRYIAAGNYAEALLTVAVLLFFVFCCFPIHEYAHAKMAVKLGDDTPRLAGRLTLNPMAHIDFLGTAMMLLVGFGYAKPVPVNMHNLKHGRRDFALVAFAGPLSNLMMAFIFAFLDSTVRVLALKSILPMAAAEVLVTFCYLAMSINISLAVFNLLPIPPLDGSRILNLILPEKYYFLLMRYERYIVLAVFALLFIGVLDIPLDFLSGLAEKGIYALASLIYKLTGLL